MTNDWVSGMKNKLLKLSLGLMATSALTACGGNNTGTVQQNSAAITAQFLDSAVSNLQYESISSRGVTDAAGNFQCVLSEDVSFYIGSLQIGTSICQRIITPQTLAADIVVQSQPQTITSASGVVTTVAGSGQTIVTPASPGDPAVVNRVRLLMTLDIDDDPSNGIQLPSNTEQNQITQTSINFQNTSDFDNEAIGVIQQVPSVSNKSVVDPIVAENHFNTTLQNLPQVTAQIPSNTGSATVVPIGQYYDDSTGGFDEDRLEQEHPELSEQNNRRDDDEDDDEFENEREEFDDD